MTNDEIDDLNRIRFAKRLHEAKGDESARSFAQRAGVSSNVMNQYLSGKSEPTRPNLMKIAEAAHVNLEWLATGRGAKSDRDEDLERYLDDITLALSGVDVPLTASALKERADLIEMREELRRLSGRDDIGRDYHASIDRILWMAFSDAAAGERLRAFERGFFGAVTVAPPAASVPGTSMALPAFLTEVIAVVEEVLARDCQTLPPRKKAELIGAAYEFARGNEADLVRIVERLAKLAS